MKRNLFAFLALGLGLASFACGTDSSSTLTSPSQPRSVDHSATKSAYSSVIDLAGGGVAIGSNSLQIPSGALSVPIAITVQVHDAADGAVFEFGPHGLQFASPCTLTLDVPDGADPADFTIAWFNETADTWVDIGGWPNGNSISTTVGHFSLYKVIDRTSLL